ncbi:uncharacterized protein LOC121430777 [Lytechinus variegatus]|uniref:uncharacterized protein LOC121430777 n=1 Tax=Lytechinus variegatus TaxID=7654 RepID=UPI001BB133A9|nr:uncharacterized protein LOC121430777 [Lytechinus variegatus]
MYCTAMRAASTKRCTVVAEPTRVGLASIQRCVAVAEAPQRRCPPAVEHKSIVTKSKNDTPFFPASVRGTPEQLTVELHSGSPLNLISESTADFFGLEVVIDMFGYSDYVDPEVSFALPSGIVGITSFSLFYDGCELYYDGFVVEDSVVNFDVMAGAPFMEKNDVSIRPSKRQIMFGDYHTFSYMSSSNQFQSNPTSMNELDELDRAVGMIMQGSESECKHTNPGFDSECKHTLPLNDCSQVHREIMDVGCNIEVNETEAERPHIHQSNDNDNIHNEVECSVGENETEADRLHTRKSNDINNIHNEVMDVECNVEVNETEAEHSHIHQSNDNDNIHNEVECSVGENETEADHLHNRKSNDINNIHNEVMDVECNVEVNETEADHPHIHKSYDNNMHSEFGLMTSVETESVMTEYDVGNPDLGFTSPLRESKMDGEIGETLSESVEIVTVTESKSSKPAVSTEDNCCDRAKLCVKTVGAVGSHYNCQVQHQHEHISCSGDLSCVKVVGEFRPQNNNQENYQHRQFYSVPDTEPSSASGVPGTEPSSVVPDTEPSSGIPDTEPSSGVPDTKLSSVPDTEPTCSYGVLDTEPSSGVPGTEHSSGIPGNEPSFDIPDTELSSNTKPSCSVMVMSLTLALLCLVLNIALVVVCSCFIVTHVSEAEPSLAVAGYVHSADITSIENCAIIRSLSHDLYSPFTTVENRIREIHDRLENRTADYPSDIEYVNESIRSTNRYFGFVRCTRDHDMPRHVCGVCNADRFRHFVFVHCTRDHDMPRHVCGEPCHRTDAYLDIALCSSLINSNHHYTSLLPYEVFYGCTAYMYMHSVASIIWSPYMDCIAYSTIDKDLAPCLSPKTPTLLQNPADRLILPVVHHATDPEVILLLSYLCDYICSGNQSSAYDVMTSRPTSPLFEDGKAAHSSTPLLHVHGSLSRTVLPVSDPVRTPAVVDQPLRIQPPVGSWPRCVATIGHQDWLLWTCGPRPPSPFSDGTRMIPNPMMYLA